MEGLVDKWLVSTMCTGCGARMRRIVDTSAQLIHDAIRTIATGFAQVNSTGLSIEFIL